MVNKTASHKTAPNIALIKYWGKLDDELNLPLNSSISITLDPQVICSSTTVCFGEGCEESVLILNDTASPFSTLHLKAVQFFLALQEPLRLDDGSTAGYEVYKHWKFSVKSTNNFPTAAGLASSASGFAAFAVCLAKVFDYFKLEEGADVESHIETLIARLAEGSPATEETFRVICFVNMVRRLSGSACRSLFRGFSLFRGPELLLNREAGLDWLAKQSIWQLFREQFSLGGVNSNLQQEVEADGRLVASGAKNELFAQMLHRYFLRETDSLLQDPAKMPAIKSRLDFLCSAVPLACTFGHSLQSAGGLEKLKEDVAILVLVLDPHTKKIGSKSGMIESSKTSDFLVSRVACLEQRIQDMAKHISAGHMEEMNRLTMQDSNAFHAVCLDSCPPIRYLTDASHGIQCAVNELNRAVGCAAFAYTFDAGPNPFLISSCKHMPLMLHLLAKLGKSVRSAPTAKPSFEPDEQQLKLAAQLETEGLLAAFEPVCEAILSRTLSK